MDKLPANEQCEHCKKRVLDHSTEWQRAVIMGEPHADEIDTNELTYGCHRKWVTRSDVVGKQVSWAGTRLEGTICNKCWEAGRKFDAKGSKK